MAKIPHIVIVGGGAGGIELATRLGNTLGKKKKAQITLVDANITHLWKPLWHEVAAGTLDSQADELNYITHGYAHHFSFEPGSLKGLQRAEKKIFLAPLYAENQQELLPARTLSYDILVIAVGSITHQFNTPGVAEHCILLDSRQQTEYFRQRFLKTLIASRAEAAATSTIAIVGGGATGVELAAELHYVALQAARYGLTEKPAVSIAVIEAAPSILVNLPAAVIRATERALSRRHIDIYTNERVIRADSSGLYTQQRFIPAEIKVWTAGIKAPDFLKNLDGLETNHLNQLIVNDTLQTTRDENIFAFGDCAYCVDPATGRAAPPRAQTAHQQAIFLAKTLPRYIAGKPLSRYRFHDYGALVTLGQQQIVGNLMGRITRNVFVSGWMARMAYRFLYRQHQAVLHGWWRVLLMMMADTLARTVRPRLKLH